MDANHFDHLARSLTSTTRRAAAGWVLAALFPALFAPPETSARLRRKRQKQGKELKDERRTGVLGVEKKRKKRKKRRCKPDCPPGRCGSDGCKGRCAFQCAEGQRCNAQGRCVGCLETADCPPLACKTLSCIEGTCEYASVADAENCAGGLCCGDECLANRVCCDDAQCQDPDRPHCDAAGQCAECLLDGHCPVQDCLTPVCVGGACDVVPVEDGVSCGDGDTGICCDAICQAGGECCDDSHCQSGSAHICLDGQCVECLATEDCPSPGPCQQGPTCQDNACAYPPRGDHTPCPGGQTDEAVCCDGVCRDIKFDPQRCGDSCATALPCGPRADHCFLGACRCGGGAAACPVDATCQEGFCVCAGVGKVFCGGECKTGQCCFDQNAGVTGVVCGVAGCIPGNCCHLGNFCASNEDCCIGICAGKCCLPSGDPCIDPGDCCSNFCQSRGGPETFCV